jgi:hypothetical protein
VLTLVQTGKSVPAPIVFIDKPGGDFWQSWQEYVHKHLLGSKLIGEDDLHLYTITDDVEAAAREVRHFYKNYHSIRYSRDELVIRLSRAPNEAQLAEINDKFADIKVKGAFRVSEALPVERDEPALLELPRLIFTFNRKDHGRLRMLINYLNDLN